MTTRLSVQHISRYLYDQPVTASFNEARLTPLTTVWQYPLESVLRVDEASWEHQYTDYWGTTVRVFEAQRAHSELVVQATSVVELDASRIPQTDKAMSWDTVRGSEIVQRLGEYLSSTASTAPEPQLAARAEKLAAANSPHETALALCTFVNEQMTYQPGSTGVYTTAREAWKVRSGVCQDYAHLVVGALRHVGLPARYVSGYLHPNRDAEIGEPAAGESHAWVEWWLGEWAGHDPTNDAEIGERHILVGRGRDYRDVPPIKGIVAGSAGASELSVSVEVTRLA